MRKTLAVLSAATVLASLMGTEAHAGRVRLFSIRARAAPVQGLARPGTQGQVETSRSGGLVALPLPGPSASLERASGPDHAITERPNSASSEVLDIPTGSLVPAAEVPSAAA